MVAANSVVAELIHFNTTHLASAKSGTRKGLTEQRHAQAKLERRAKLGGLGGKAETREAREASRWRGIEQASIRLLLRILDLPISLRPHAAPKTKAAAPNVARRGRPDRGSHS